MRTGQDRHDGECADGGGSEAGGDVVCVRVGLGSAAAGRQAEAKQRGAVDVVEFAVRGRGGGAQQLAVVVDRHYRSDEWRGQRRRRRRRWGRGVAAGSGGSAERDPGAGAGVRGRSERDAVPPGVSQVASSDRRGAVGRAAEGDVPDADGDGAERPGDNPGEVRGRGGVGPGDVSVGGGGAGRRGRAESEASEGRGRTAAAESQARLPPSAGAAADAQAEARVAPARQSRPAPQDHRPTQRPGDAPSHDLLQAHHRSQTRPAVTLWKRLHPATPQRKPIHACREIRHFAFGRLPLGQVTHRQYYTRLLQGWRDASF